MTAIAMLLAANEVVRAEPDDSATASEYQLKAAFVYNFAKFVEWPEGAGAVDTVNLCVSGPEVAYATEVRVVSGKKLKGHPVTVRWLHSPADVAQQCQILFVASPGGELVRQTLAAVRDGPVLTVGECPGFLKAGGMINFLLRDSRVRFEINLAAARKAHLTISSELLRLATYVAETEEAK